MADLANVYETTRSSIVDFLRERPREDLDRPVPATPGWTVRNVLSHLVGDIECVVDGDFPSEFFAAFAEPAAIEKLNKWTEGHVRKRSDRSLEEIVDEWDGLVPRLYPLMSGERDWPEGVPFFGAHVLTIDIGVHQQDIFGAFGVKRDREGVPVKLGVSGYMAAIGWRLQSDGGGKLILEAEKQWAVGEGNPEATVRGSRFEFFRALSGRRSLDQLRAYEWRGDPEPFLKYFYPYGIRSEALVE